MSAPKRDRFIHVGRLELAVPKRKPGIREAYIKVGKPVTIRGQPFWQVKESDYQAIRKEFVLDKAPIPKASPGNALLPQRPSAPPKLPPLTMRAKNAASAVTRVITAAAKGREIQVPDAEFQRRMDICVKCPSYVPNGLRPRCSQCACFLASQLIGKARLATEKCPINSW